MTTWWRSSPEIGGREIALAALAAALLSLVLFWPLPLHLGRDIPLDTGDPLSQAWQVAWDGHALTAQPLHLFQANQFWPLRNTLAFSDALLGYAPAGLIGSGPHAAVVRYDVLFLFAAALALLGAYLLARELGASRWASAVGGAAFGCAPWRLEQGGHLHVLSSGGIPLALFLLLRGYRRERPGLIVAGWAVCAWQFSLGFTLGLQLGYLLVVLVLIAAAWWRRAGRPRPARGPLVATAVGVGLFALVAIILARPYLQVLHDHPEARRTAALVARYSGPPRMFLAASHTDLVWGALTAGVRHSLPVVPEETLFPGLAILALAIAGLGWRGYPRPLRIGLGVAAVVLAVLSLGFQMHGVGRFLPYRLLYDVVPGWKGIRVPGRLHTLTTLALALLAAGGAARATAAVRLRRGPHAAGALAAVLLALVILEGAGFGVDRGGAALAGYPHPRAPRIPKGLSNVPAPLLELPVRPDDNRRYLLWSTAGFPRMLNGRSSFDPRAFVVTTRAVEGFPDAASVALLRARGVRSVVIHSDTAPGSAWATWASRPIVGLGLRRERRGTLVIYRLDG
ncbi:MAG TPA: hypothetical protein VMT10_02825 [Solirubrobacteraceae bacterium]|nr:hypothetical protein [Solirubrobacteraceae bacterium]